MGGWVEWVGGWIAFLPVGEAGAHALFLNRTDSAGPSTGGSGHGSSALLVLFDNLLYMGGGGGGWVGGWGVGGWVGGVWVYLELVDDVRVVIVAGLFLRGRGRGGLGRGEATDAEGHLFEAGGRGVCGVFCVGAWVRWEEDASLFGEEERGRWAREMGPWGFERGGGKGGKGAA